MYFWVSLTIFFDFVALPPFCSISYLIKSLPSDNTKENCETSLKSTLCYAAIIK